MKTDLEVNKHGTVAWGECHVVGLGNINSYQVIMTMDHSGWDGWFSLANIVVKICNKFNFVTELKERGIFVVCINKQIIILIDEHAYKDFSRFLK